MGWRGWWTKGNIERVNDIGAVHSPIIAFVMVELACILGCVFCNLYIFGFVLTFIDKEALTQRGA